jgi:iron complex outermembrane receptor protein
LRSEPKIFLLRHIDFQLKPDTQHANPQFFTGRLTMRFTKTILASSIATIVMPFTPTHAQTAPTPDSADKVDEIVVTARRVSEVLSRVPASITAISADTIAKTGIKNAQDFVQLTPGVTIVTGSAEAGDTQINIRGLNGARDAESSVALVVDGILKTNSAAINQRQGTLKQIEILKGPQGALYGRNAAAGAIVIQTLKPGSKAESGITASYANHNTFNGNGYYSAPIGEGVGIVLSGDYHKTDGFYKNVFLNQNVVDNQKSGNIEGRLVADLGGSTTLDAKLHVGKLDGASINFNSSFHLPNFAAVNPAFFEDVNKHPFNYYGNIVPTNTQRTTEASVKIVHDFSNVAMTAWAAYSNIKNDLTADGTSADFARYISPALGAPSNTTNTAVQNKCFSSTAALTGFKINQPGFVGAIPVPFIFAPANGSTFGAYSPTTCDGTQYQSRNQKDFSAEIRFASLGDAPLSWQAGAYYLNIDRDVGVSLGADLGLGVSKQLYNAPGSSNPTSQLFADNFKTDVYAFFGSVDYKVDDKILVGAALRYDSEHRKTHNLVPVATDPITGSAINPGQAFGQIADKAANFNQIQPKLTYRWEFAPKASVYANWGVGFKSGGFNNQGSAAIVRQNFNTAPVASNPTTILAGVTIGDQYRKEKSSAFEAGVRGTMGPISYDLAAFYTNVTDMQFFEFFVGSFGLLRVVNNIDKVDLKGAELNLSTKITKGWSVFTSYNVTDSNIKANSSRPYTVGNKSPYTADYTLNVGTQMEMPVSNGLNAVLRTDYRVTGPTYFHTVQNTTAANDRPTLFSGLLPISALALPAAVGNARYNVSRRDAFGLLDLRMGLESKAFRFTVFASNLLDKKYLSEVIPAIEFGGSFISPGARRLIGAEVNYKF